MAKTIRAVFEEGVFKPEEKVSLPEHQPVEVVIPEDIPTHLIAYVAEKDESFSFLSEPGEDIYTLNDGETV